MQRRLVAPVLPAKGQATAIFANTRLAKAGSRQKLRGAFATYLDQNALYDFTMHISQPVVPALELEGEPGMVNAEAVEDGRV